MAKPFDSIIDAFLADREPNWKELGLDEAQKSGEEQKDRTHQYVDKEFMDDIAESASRHTPIPPSKSATLTSRLSEKEKAVPQIAAVKADWHKDAYRRMDEYKSREGNDESLFSEVTESIEAAATSANFGENNVRKREITDGQVQKYVRDLLNQGETPAKVAQQLSKLAEIELFNHQSATDYLQRNAGMLGLAYLEPNTYMDKQNPNYRHDNKKLSSADSKDCIRSHEAMKKDGIASRAKSVKQVRACQGCTYFKRDASGKHCNLYHLPVVANVEELSQIVNNLTPGVPQNKKHAALVQIANREGEHAQPFDAGKTAQTSVVKTADAKVGNQAMRKQARMATFTSSHLAKLHEKGVPLAEAYKWANRKFGSVETSVAFRGFVNTLKKNDGGKIVVAASDLQFLNSIGIRSEKFEGGAKCASCPSHFGREARIVENDRGAMRVGGKFAQRTASAVASQREEAEATVTASDVRLMHQKGHSLERIYAVAAKKVGSLEAKKVVAQYLADLKKVPGRIQVNASDRGFLGKIGFKPEALRTLESVRPAADRVVVPYQSKYASAKEADGHAILNEYDLTGAPKQDDIDVDGPERLDVESGNSFKVDLG